MNGVDPGTGLGFGGGTLRRAAVAAALLAAALGGVAVFWKNGATPHPLDAYRRLGDTAGAAALRRDLLADHPAGSAPAPLLRRLESLGLRCAPLAEGWACSRTAQAGDHRVARTLVTLGVVDGALATADVRMSDQAVP